jgi:O-antigen/teichoic acid export membrane protein
VFLTHTHSIAALIAAWGLGALAGALYGLHQYRVLPSFSGGWAMLRGHWSMSKWLAGTSLSSSGTVQLSTFIAGLILGPVGLGGLRAAQTLVMGPSGVLIMAGGSVGLPEASKAYTEKGRSGLLKVARVVTLCGFFSFLAGLLVIVFFGKSLLTAIYGPSFAHLEVAAILMAIAYMIISFTLGPVLVLKATRNTRPLFHIQVFSLVVSLASLAVLAEVWGVDGAAGATAVTFAAGALGTRWVQHRALQGRYKGGDKVDPSQPLDELAPSRPEPGVEPVF